MAAGDNMKNWPEDGKPVRFTDLTEPIREAVDHLYELKRKPKCDVPWTGYTLGKENLVGCLAPTEQLTVFHLDYNEHDQGRDPMLVLIGIAVQLGIEQGRRSERQTYQNPSALIKGLAKQIIEISEVRIK